MKVKNICLLHDNLLVSAERLPDKVVLVVEGKAYTYSQLLESSLRLARGLQERGLERGDRAAIYLGNTWECAVSIFGVLLAGGVFLVVNPQTKAHKLEYIINDNDTKFLLTDGHLSKIFTSCLTETPKLKEVICSGKIPPSPPDSACPITPFNEVLEKSSPLTEMAGTIPLDLAALIYTSGSTGDPKGVMMTHQSMVFAVNSLSEYLRLSENERILCVIPMAFDYGLYQLLMAVKLGATLVLERSFTFPSQILNRLNEQKATVFPGVPTIFATLLSMYGIKEFKFDSITRVTNTAAALPADFIPTLRKIFPNALIYKMYGLTECKRVCYLEPEDLDERITSVGKAIPGTEIFLLSPEGESVPPGEQGILHVRGPHVMLGYWKKGEATGEMLKPGELPGERILCAQDWFTMDEEGYFYFKGRSDDIIKTRGEKVSPVEVENMLHSIKGVKEAAVLGVPDSSLGQAVKAFVALDEAVVLTEKQIQKECLSKLENFMVPKEVVFLPELPKTSTGKIQKNGLDDRT